MAQIQNIASTSFDYKIDPASATLPGIKTSNTATVDLILGSLSMANSASKTYATIGDTIKYTIVITNNGNVLATNINFKGTIPTGTTFTSGSVTVGGISQPTYNPQDGFNIGDLILLESITVTFDVTVTTLPVPNIVSNKATTTFDYTVTGIVTGSAESNAATTTINVMDIELVKSASVSAVEKGNSLSFTTIITNNGNIDATDVIFTDIVPTELTFTPGTVTINTIPEPTFDPNIGFTLGTIAPNSSVNVTFSTTVN